MTDCPGRTIRPDATGPNDCEGRPLETKQNNRKHSARIYFRTGLVLGIGSLLIASVVLGEPGDDTRPRSRNQSRTRSRTRADYGSYSTGRSGGYRLSRVQQDKAEDKSDGDKKSGSTRRSFLPKFGGSWFKKDKSNDVPEQKPPFDPKAKNLRLRFYNASWSHVLNKICEDSHSELVMDKVPPGRFSIYKRGKFTRKEVVRVLNEDLADKDFRLDEKGKYLDVVFLRSARAKYHRPQMPRYERRTQTTRPEPTPFQPQKYSRDVHSISRTRRAVAQQEQALLRQASATRKAKSAKPAVRVVQPRHHKALAIARAIYKPLKTRAELIDAGPAGLPAFRVYEPVLKSQPRTAKRRVAFTMGIDTKSNELIVESDARRATSVVELVRYLDTTQVAKDEILKIVPTNTDPTPIVETLRPQLAMLMQMQKKQPDGNQPDAKKKKQIQAVVPPRGGAAGVFPNIRGRVTIRDVPGVGLVITGNQEDVEAVLRIIRELDRQGELSKPNIHIQMLKNVNAQAMAILLSAVYQQLATIRTGQTQSVGTVGFIPVLHPNALMILSSKADLDAVLKLIDQLDRPIDPEKEYRVFHLKHAISSVVVANLDALFQQQATTGGNNNQNQNLAGLAARVRAIADVRSNAVIIEAAPNDMKVVANLIYKLDTETIKSVSRIRVFKLKNAVATELATLLNNSIQSVLNPAQFQATGGGATGAGQNSQQLREVKSSILEFMVADGDRKRLVKSGLLTDIRVTADPRINALIVTAPETSLSLMEQIIKQLDQPSALVAEIKVFNLANGDATAMVTLLQSMFPPPTGNQQAGQGQLGYQVADADDASSGLIPLRFAVNARTNSVIAIGGAGALRVVEAIIFRLDESDLRRRQTTVIRLQNTPVTEVSTALNQFLQAQQDLAQIDPNLVTNAQRLEQEIIVVPETISNNLLVSATPRYFDEIKAIIARLDKAPPQVVIQALIVEVELNNTDEFGVELGFQDDLLFNRGIASILETLDTTTTAPSGVTTTSQQIIAQTSTPGFNFNNAPLGANTAFNPGSVGRQGLSNFSLGRVNGDLGFGGLVLSAQSSSVSVLLRALSAKRTVHVLSRPQITALDNQIAQINVGQIVPRTQGVNVTANGNANPNVVDTQVGLILNVTPRIRPDNVVVMETVATNSSLSGQGVPIFTDASTGNVIESPIINETSASTTLAVPNGQTVVMGGLITKSDDTIARKVPWLGDAPILKYLFRYDTTITRRTELLIFLTPRIIRDDADFEIIKQIESERMHFIEEDAENLHGPLFATPADSNTMPSPVSTSRRNSNQKRRNVKPAGYDDDSVPTTRVNQTSGFTSSAGGVETRGRLGGDTSRRNSAGGSSSRDDVDPSPYIKKKKSWFSNPFKR